MPCSKFANHGNPWRSNLTVIPRPEHPRPDFERTEWINLNGVWAFEPDSYEVFSGKDRLLHAPLKETITVPFPYQSRLSGIGRTGHHPCVWYRRSFEVPAPWLSQRVQLHFGAVDYEARVWVNGHFVGEHRGGHVPFEFEIQRWLVTGPNELTVRAADAFDISQPRGKQAWAEPFGCWYTPTTGIWQTVWLESVPEVYTRSIRVDADPSSGEVTVIAVPNQPAAGLTVRSVALRDGAQIAASQAPMAYPSTRLTFRVPNIAPWSPESPALYDLVVTLEEGDRVLDRVRSYFGARTVTLEQSSVLLNGEPCYQRLVLDQGFWPDGLYTAPTDEALKADVELALALGFNGCRKHQKVEDPRFLYWADRLGFLVWGEFPAPYEFSLAAQARFLPEWQTAIQRDINHPSIVAWVPYNESWGIPGVGKDPTVQDWVRTVVGLTRFLDPTRLVVDNEGWEHVDSDLIGYHTYAPTGEQLTRELEVALATARGQGAEGDGGPGLRRLMADGVPLPPRPLMLTEFGGIGFSSGAADGASWGYHGVPGDLDAFRQRFESIFVGLRRIPDICGWVYTQLTDVQQEINGLLTPDRRNKFDPLWVRRWVSGGG